jgi:hypothetical protein
MYIYMYIYMYMYMYIFVIYIYLYICIYKYIYIIIIGEGVIYMGDLIPWEMVTDKNACNVKSKYLDEGNGLYSRNEDDEVCIYVCICMYVQVYII